MCASTALSQSVHCDGRLQKISPSVGPQLSSLIVRPAKNVLECNRLFSGANRVHMAFDGVTVAGDKTLNVVIGARLKESTPLLRIGTKVWFWAPPQVTVVVAFSGTSVAYRRCKRATIVISIVAQSHPYQMCHYRNPCHQCHSLRQFVHDHRHKQAQG